MGNYSRQDRKRKKKRRLKNEATRQAHAAKAGGESTEKAPSTEQGGQ